MVSAVQEYRGSLISVNNSNDKTLGHIEDYYFPINFSVLLHYFPFLNYFLDYFTVISHSSIVFPIISQLFLISQVFTVRENLGLLTPLAADYVTRPFFPPPQRKMGKSGLAMRDYLHGKAAE